jgi:hypothetical protein
VELAEGEAEVRVKGRTSSPASPILVVVDAAGAAAHVDDVAGLFDELQDRGTDLEEEAEESGGLYGRHAGKVSTEDSGRANDCTHLEVCAGTTVAVLWVSSR